MVDFAHMGNSSPRAVRSVADDAGQADTSVENMKENSGNGVSSRIILFNNTKDDMHFQSDQHFSGRWENTPPAVIGPGKFGCFLHVKKSGAACGSVACVEYSVGPSRVSKVYIGWDTPFSGTNKFGIELFGQYQAPQDKEALCCLSNGTKYTAFIQGYVGTGEFWANDASTKLYFVVQDQ